MAQGAIHWAHLITVGLVTAVAPATAQALADRVPSSVSNKQEEITRRSGLVAAGAGLLSGILLAVDGMTDMPVAGRIGEGLLNGGIALGAQLGMAAVDQAMGLTDPSVAPTAPPPIPPAPAPLPSPMAGRAPAPPAVNDAFNPLRSGYRL